ncbi:uncharacterized protein DS421_7g209490 [Arachis hypogaea]|nr:uncharacterized protein DS421_7g209490 [Arachis hypogaea]
MRLDERYVSYLQMARLYHLTRLNDRWFRLDEPFVSAFVERWRPKTHTFYMPFRECAIILQGVAYQLGLPVDGRYVNGCLIDFQIYIQGDYPAWVWFQELLGVLPPANQIQKFAVNCTWFQETFGEYPAGADEETVRRFARAYIMMPASYDEFSWPLASRWSGHNPSGSEKGPRVQMWRLRIDMLQASDFIWMSYSSPDVLQVVHPEGVTAVRRSTAPPQPTLNIDFLMSKDGRGGDRWFPYSLQFWHIHWENRVDHVLRDVPGDPRAVPILVEVMQRGAGRVPDMDRMDDVPDRRRVERRARVGGRRGRGSRRRARGAGHDQGDHSDDDDGGHQHGPDGGDDAGHAGVGGVSPHHGGHDGEWYGSGMGDGSSQGGGGLDFLAGDGLDADFGRSHFLDEISAIMQEDELARRRGPVTGTQAPLDVDLNEPPTVAAPDYFALGGTPPSAYTAGSNSIAGPSKAPVRGESFPSGSASRPLDVQPRPPAQPAPDDNEDEMEDEEPFIRRGYRTRVPRRCGTGSHLFR